MRRAGWVGRRAARAGKDAGWMMNSALSSEKPDRRVRGASFRPANRASMPIIVALSEVTAPFAAGGFDRTTRNVAGEVSGDAPPARNLRAIPARFSTITAALPGRKGAPTPIAARRPRCERVYPRTKRVYPRATASTLTQSASSQLPDALDARDVRHARLCWLWSDGWPRDVRGSSPHPRAVDVARTRSYTRDHEGRALDCRGRVQGQVPRAPRPRRKERGRDRRYQARAPRRQGGSSRAAGAASASRKRPLSFRHRRGHRR